MPNVLLVVAAVETLPCELYGHADEVTVNFPWGSLLRGIVRAEAAVLGPLGRIAKPGARVRALLSVEGRDRASGLDPLDVGTLASRTDEYAAAGFAVERCAEASRDEMLASGSSWAKRLGDGRHVFALELRRTRG